MGSETPIIAMPALLFLVVVASYILLKSVLPEQ